MNHFETSFTLAHAEALAEAVLVNLAVFTTAATPYSPGASIGDKLIGGLYSRRHFEKLHGAGANCLARLRVLGVHIPKTEQHMAWDFDAMNESDQEDLIHAAINGKNLLGHDLARSLMWLLQHAGKDLAPAKVLDTMLLARFSPDKTWALHEMAAQGNEGAQRIVNTDDGEAPCTLGALYLASTGSTLDEGWVGPHNWCMKNLCAGHWDGLMEVLDAQSDVFFSMDRPRESYFDIWQHQPMRLARMSQRGMPISRERLDGIKAARMQRIEATGPLLIEHIPGLADHAARLTAGVGSVPDDIKKVLAAYASENGFTLETGKTGVPIISSKKVKLNGAYKLPGWELWTALQSAKQVAGLCDVISTYSMAHPMSPTTHRTLHPLFAQSTVTLRCATEAPTVQNFPRPEALPADFMPGCADRDEAYALLQLRSAVEALPGWVIIAADYGQIELRITACLALRAIDEANAAQAGEFNAPSWVLEALALGASDAPINETSKGFEAHKNDLALAWRGVCQRGTPMADIFRLGLDPHLLTGLSIAARRGAIDLAGSTPLQYLGELDRAGTDALKITIAADRQSAKPTNFGLLFGSQAKSLWSRGITDYGLSWTLEEASQARDTWMNDFCDLRFWQLWVSYVHKAPKDQATTLYRKNQWTKEVTTKAYQMRTSTTLLGKPVCTPDIRECLNHQSQATGAEMIALAITKLGFAERYMVNLIHDELVAHCPESLAEAVKFDIEECMLEAANQILGPWEIPAEVESKVTKRWGK